ncbi:hypothetical protein FSP39_007049 [Pinctada imbricata]|uniref:Major facilitator superfamily (MFS) profile domain-containing protein n=1 Tax=Pinctada imbricata TaxID=66713 RepID=A0AA88YVU4_PINIB|nr:hypothetical protein FSP39_007049 [Pinctada imbricata]
MDLRDKKTAVDTEKMEMTAERKDAKDQIKHEAVVLDEGHVDHNNEDQSLNYELLLLKMKAETEITQLKKCSCHAQSSTSSSGEDLAPDGGWGWMVCLGSFFINFILDGTMFTFGIILLELLDEFKETKAKTAWIGSVQLGISMLLGPIVGWLLDHFSIRQVTIGGALIATSGFLSSVFAPTVDILIFTYGFLGGVGICMMFLPAIIAVGLYFSRKRALATGIASSGSGLGVFAYAYICELMLSTFNWRGTVLILAGLILNCAAFGALFRPLNKRHCRSKRTAKCYVCVENSSSNSSSSEKSVFLQRSSLQVEQNIFNSTSVLDRKLLHKHAQLFDQNDIRQVSSSDANLAKRTKTPEYDVNFNPLTRKDIFYSGSVRNLHMPCVQITELHSENSSTISKNCQSIECVKSESKTVDFSLLCDLRFLLCMGCMTLWTAHGITLTYLPDIAVANGLSRDQGAILISVCGVSNTLIRIGAGIATDMFHISSTHIYIVALCVGSVTNFLFPWCGSFLAFVVCAAAFGLCMACAVSLRTIVIAEHLGIQRLTSAFSMIAFFQGLAFVVGPPIAGLVYDLTGSHLHPFLLAGGMYLISALLCVPLACMPKRGNIPEMEITLESESTSDESLLRLGKGETIERPYSW